MRFDVTARTPNREPAAPRHDSRRERRADERYSLGEAFGHLKHRGSMIPCQFIDISLSGCKVRTESPFTPGALAEVQIVIMVFGLVLRMDGTTQWTKACDMGIRFAHSSFRSKDQLAGLLTCLIDKDAQQTVQEAFSQAVRDPVSNPIVPVQVSSPPRAPVPTYQPEVPPTPAPSNPVPPPALSKPAEPFARAEAKVLHEPLGPLITTIDEWPALIRFLYERTHAQGTITGLSMQGCAVRAEKPFLARTGSRVEMSFQVRGLPFQLPGFIVEISGQGSAQIRFLELSRRKHEELQQVLDELSEAVELEKSHSE